jgi:hypothetical protein
MAMTFMVCVSKPESRGGLSFDDLTLGRAYEVLVGPDEHGFVRIYDDSGEDYLYPADLFEPISIQESGAHRLHEALTQE